MYQNFVVRRANDTDLSLIVSTWLHGLYHSNTWFNEIEKDVFWENYRKVIEAILAYSDVNVACLPDEPDVILGYVVYTGPILHWIFVKKAFRKLGIGKTLLPDNINTITHLTDVGRALKRPEWQYNPFKIGMEKGR